MWKQECVDLNGVVDFNRLVKWDQRSETQNINWGEHLETDSVAFDGVKVVLKESEFDRRISPTVK